MVFKDGHIGHITRPRREFSRRGAHPSPSPSPPSITSKWPEQNENSASPPGDWVNLAWLNGLQPMYAEQLNGPSPWLHALIFNQENRLLFGLYMKRKTSDSIIWLATKTVWFLSVVFPSDPEAGGVWVLVSNAHQETANEMNWGRLHLSPRVVVIHTSDGVERGEILDSLLPPCSLLLKTYVATAVATASKPKNAGEL